MQYHAAPEHNQYPENLSPLQQSLALELFRVGAFRVEERKVQFHDLHPEAPLSPVYIDFRVLRRLPQARDAAIQMYTELIHSLPYDFFADIPTGSSTLVGALADRLGVGIVTPRMQEKKHGIQSLADGVLSEDAGKVAILFDDLTTKGESKIIAAQKLRQCGLIVQDVVVLLDREQGGREELAYHGLTLHAACTLNQLLQFYLAERLITPQQYEHITHRLTLLAEYKG